MMTTTHARLAGRLLFALVIVAMSSASAETITLQATSDFPIIDAGEVPYYSEVPDRPSLAINAANVAYRDKFARATVVYQGESGFFDVTINALAELDGEARYRLLVNDVLMGIATNPAVTVDYTPVRHTFEDIVVPAGSTLAVESLANTNGNIPEGDGTAFARGRWTSLELNNDESGVGPASDVDLSVDVNSSESSVQVGDTFTLSLDIANGIDTAVATSVQLTVTRPRAEIGVMSIGTCVEAGNDIVCDLSEIPAGGSEQVSLTLEALEPSPTALMQVAVSADQSDRAPQNNSLLVPLTITGTADNTIPIDVTPPTGNASEGSRSGGGALSWATLLILLTWRKRGSGLGRFGRLRIKA